MMKRISSPIEALIDSANTFAEIHETDYLIVGSGYGGAVAANRLATQTSALVTVLERGQEYLPGDFPYDIEDLPSHVRLVPSAADAVTQADADGAGTGGYANALFNLHIGASTGADNSSVDILVGSGLGGTSLINANVAEEPNAEVFKHPHWPIEFRNEPFPLKDAFKGVKEALQLTRRTTTGGETFAKYSALERVAAAAKATAEPASIAVSAGGKDNGHGLRQPECSDCGNCITGCNTGAKSTLDRNLLRSAASAGALLYTGASVVWVEDNTAGKRRWKVSVTPTVSPGTTGKQDTYYILADKVILAAGTLGSTEILMRSRERKHLSPSSKLGEHFSSNGDGIAFTYGQNSPVNTIAEAEQKAPERKVGPTITGKIRTHGLTIEDASVPASMARVFAELTTTGAMLGRLANRHVPRAVAKCGQDPLAASLPMAQHSQALLIMGDDGATGHLSYNPFADRVGIHFPAAGQNPALQEAHNLLSKMDRNAGFDGGQYVPNPLWKLLPEGASGALSGAMPPSRALTVHPLGGCTMGDSVAEGVVNHAGQVFREDGSLYDGLYVFDGAIVPTALGINPFLTIAALAWRNCDFLIKAAASPKKKDNAAKPFEIIPPDRERVRPEPLSFEIDEQMIGELPTLPENFRKRFDKSALARLRQKHGLVVNVQAEHQNAEQWLDNPGANPLPANMTLYINPIEAQAVMDFQPVGVRSRVLDSSATKLLHLDGKFEILCEDSYSRLSDYWEGLCSIITYLKRREFDLGMFGGGKGSPPTSIRSKLRNVRAFCNIGMLQSRRRRIRYTFRNIEHDIIVSGDKVLGFDMRLPRLWPALLNLEGQLQEGNSKPVPFTLTVNSEKLIDPGLIQVTRAAHLPQSLLFAGGLASYFARSLVATQFWEFGGVNVPDTPHKQRTLPRPLHIPKDTNNRHPAKTIDPACTELEVPVRQFKTGETQSTIPLLLTNYSNPGKPPVLMLHGLAQGSQIFWTDSLEHNLANTFFANGFDVWLVDYRLSNHVLPSLQDKDWSIDEIAQFDIPLAIDAVLEATEKKQLAIVAHCVGACGLAMAALRDKTLGKKISAAVTNAIHPWVISSPGNRFRAKLGGFYREWVPQELLNPIPSTTDTAIQNVTDRLGFGLARIAEDGNHDDHKHYGDDPVVNSICDRMTFLYGRMWNHRNLAPETHNAFLDMLGPAPIGVYQHLYHFTREQRITDSQGENIYLNKSTIQSNWTFPILFVHGGDSRVFNPHSARRSAKRLSTTLHEKHGAAAPAVDCKIYPDYGHMDVIFGKEAHQNCFGDYVEFIRNPKVHSNPMSAPDWRNHSKDQLVSGPILRAAWTNNGRIRLRYWAEMRRSQAVVDDAIAVTGATVIRDREISVRPDLGSTLPRYRLLDLELPSKDGGYELSIGITGPQGEMNAGQTLHYDQDPWLHQLRKLDSEDADTMSFLLGSCRYPGSLVDNALSDKVYAALAEHTKTTDGAHLLFLTGDQIYADATDQILEIKSPKTRYTDRYRTAFGAGSSPNFSELVKRIPTHFSLDDHELTDNWSGYLKPPTPAPYDTHEYALDTATQFMGAGRQQLPLGTPGEVAFSGKRRPFYYSLDQDKECLFPTFVADTRAERQPRNSNKPASHALMEDTQLKALEAWLLSASEQAPRAPKFIVSGSIIAPLPKHYCDNHSTWRQQDGWAGYPKTMEALLAYIAKNKILNVVFVGGDAHLSAVSQLSLTYSDNPGDAAPTGNAVTVWQIVGSGLYSPLPFANSRREHFVWNKEHRLDTHVEQSLGIMCKNTFLSDHYSQFVRVDATAKQLTVTSYDADNRPLADYVIGLTQ